MDYKVIRTMVGYRIFDPRTGWFASSVVYSNANIWQAYDLVNRLNAARRERETACAVS